MRGYEDRSVAPFGGSGFRIFRTHRSRGGLRSTALTGLTSPTGGRAYGRVSSLVASCRGLLVRPVWSALENLRLPRKSCAQSD